MRQGTTPTHTFEIPMEKAMIKSAKVVYKQGDKIILCKTANDCSIEDGKITIRLTQEETLSFQCEKNVYIQVAILTQGGDAMRSDVMRVTVDQCLDGEVIA